jgi:outer membrane lipoprotein carrier protein
MKKQLFFVLLSFCLTVFADPTSELTALLTSMNSLRANYVQTTLDPKLTDKQVVEGRALLARPNQFRWEVEKPYQQLLVADGKRLWIYDADLAQVTVQTLQQNIKDTPALLLSGDPKTISTHFKVVTEDTGFTEKTFDLIPRDEDSLVRAVKLTFTGSAISRMVLIDNLHQTVTIEFSQVKINEKLSPRLFRFDPPAGVDIIGEDDLP